MNDKMIKFSLLIERVWFVFIFVFLGLSIWKFYSIGWPDAGIFFVFPAIAAVMFFIRRKTRIKLQNDKNKDESNKN